MDDVICLIHEDHTVDAIGQRVPAYSERQVFARIRSVTRSEWNNAGVKGLQPELVAITPMINYAGEKLAEWRGRRFSVYRTYIVEERDEIELYLEEKAGS